MKAKTVRVWSVIIMGALAVICLAGPVPAGAQSIYPPPYWPRDNSVSLLPLQIQIDQFQKTCRTAPGYYNNGGYDMLWKQFQALRTSYFAFKDALSPNLLYERANDLAELEAGLDVIRESFTNYQTEPKLTFPASRSFDNLCSVLSRSVKLWSQQLQNDFVGTQTIR